MLPNQCTRSSLHEAKPGSERVESYSDVMSQSPQPLFWFTTLKRPPPQNGADWGSIFTKVQHFRLVSLSKFGRFRFVALLVWCNLI